LGADNTLWALTCEKAENGENRIAKWNHFTKQWYIVPKQTGTAIAAYNEISVAVVSNSLIYVSSSMQIKAPTTITPADTTVNNTQMFGESLFLNTTTKNWLAAQLPQYKNAKLAYRATRDGMNKNAFHNLVDFKGPVLIVGISTKRFIFGGFQSINSDASMGWRQDNNAFQFNADYQIKLAAKVGGPNHINTSGYLIYYGGARELSFDDGGTANCANGGGGDFTPYRNFNSVGYICDRDSSSCTLAEVEAYLIS